MDLTPLNPFMWTYLGNLFCTQFYPCKGHYRIRKSEVELAADRQLQINDLYTELLFVEKLCRDYNCCLQMRKKINKSRLHVLVLINICIVAQVTEVTTQFNRERRHQLIIRQKLRYSSKHQISLKLNPMTTAKIWVICPTLHTNWIRRLTRVKLWSLFLNEKR